MKKGRLRGWQSQRRIIRLHDETYFGAVDAANHGYLMAEDYSAASVVGTILVGLGVLLALVVRKSRYQFGIQEG
jgi:hypothetical protein